MAEPAAISAHGVGIAFSRVATSVLCQKIHCYGCGGRRYHGGCRRKGREARNACARTATGIGYTVGAVRCVCGYGPGRGGYLPGDDAGKSAGYSFGGDYSSRGVSDGIWEERENYMGAGVTVTAMKLEQSASRLESGCWIAGSVPRIPRRQLSA
jgi:hypothetical protein